MAIEFTRIDHIAMGVEDVEQQAEIMTEIFGFRRRGAWERDGERGIVLGFGETGIDWELVQPVAADAPLRAFLDGPRGPGIHHVGLLVEDLEAARQELTRLGARAGTTPGGDELIVSADGAGEGVELRLFTEAGRPALTEPSADGAGGPALDIKRIDHICTAYPDRDTLSDHYTKLLGMRQIWRTPDGAWPDFGDCVLEIPGRQMHWEIIQPVGDDSFIQKFLDRRGPSVHHVAFEVADFDAAMRACASYEIPTFDEHDDSTDGIRWRDAFIHPKFTGGLLTQFFWEEQPDTWIHSDKVRPAGYEA